MFIIFNSLKDKLSFLEFCLECGKTVEIVEGRITIKAEIEQEIMQEYFNYKMSKKSNQNNNG